MEQPVLQIIAGPNGAGKSTLANIWLQHQAGLRFLNADIIAKGLDLASHRGAEIESAKIMLAAMRHALSSKSSFGFETTLSGRVWLKYIQTAKDNGYRISLLYVMLRNPELCLKRIRERVAHGGHDIPEAVVRRRFVRSKKMFKQLYMPLCDEWHLFDNSGADAVWIAGETSGNLAILNEKIYEEFMSDAE